MHPIKWPNEVVYQVFPDRFHCPDPAKRPEPGAFEWCGKPIRVSPSKSDVTHRQHHQYTFFGGTLEGVRRKLDHLQDLGVTALYLNPIFKSRSTHRYDTDDYFQIDPVLGTEADFKALVDDLHLRGMKIMLDGVFNHTSFYHDWYAQHPEYYLKAGPDQIETWMGTGFLPKLNPHHKEVQELLLQVIDHWQGVDGWRLDASHLLPRAFLKKLKAKVGEHRPMIGEDWDDARYDLHEGIYDGITNFSFHRNVTAAMNGDCPPETLARRLMVIVQGYPWHAVVQSWSLLNNHDTDRFFSKIGEREELYRLAQVLQFTLPGTPLVYYGDEYGMTGFGDWEARAPMVWRPSAEQKARYAHLRELIMLRRHYPALSTGKVKFLHADNESRTLAYERYTAEQRMLVALNFGPFDQILRLGGRAVEVPAKGWRTIEA